MKTSSRFGSRWVRSGSSGILLCASLALGSFQLFDASAGALSNHESSISAVSFPTPPASTASLAAWKTWSVSQRSIFSKINWVRELSNSSCHVSTATISPSISRGVAGVPKGIVTDEVTVTGTCSNVVSTPITANATSRCPVQTYGTPASAVGGSVCVGVYNSSGINYVAASYVRTATGSTYGHNELGLQGDTCAPGFLVANSHPETTVSTGNYSAVVWGPQLSSDQWTSTWWRDSNGVYLASGTACGSY